MVLLLKPNIEINNGLLLKPNIEINGFIITNYILRMIQSNVNHLK